MAELLSARFCRSVFVLVVVLEIEMRGITTPAMIPNMVTTASSSSSENPRRLRWLFDFRVFMAFSFPSEGPNSCLTDMA